MVLVICGIILILEKKIRFLLKIRKEFKGGILQWQRKKIITL